MASGKTPTRVDSDLDAASFGAAQRPAIGDAFGRYVILHEIGSGGMGVVYAAYDPELDRRVALKVLGSATSEGTGRARLLREARTMARISHPNVITVHDVGEVQGDLFIAMELVDGVDLRHWLKDHEHPWQRVLDLLVQAGRGLSAAHDQGLVHRDFKPANVLVGSDGLVRVLDFGLARRVGGPENVAASDTGDAELSSSPSSHTEPLTRTGAVAGTPAYMSPEQHARAELDDKTDQFSFCVTAFEALFGERPFSGNGRMALMLQVTQGDHRPVPKTSQVPRSVIDAVLRGLAPKPSERWPDMRALLEQLEHRPNTRRYWIGGGLGVLALGGIVAASLQDEGPSPCADLDEGAVFDTPIRAAISTAFGRTAVPYAEQALAHVLHTLDEYAAAWARTRVDVCQATHVRHDRSETAHDLAVACLEDKRRALEATSEVLADADDHTVEQSALLMEQLPALSMCTNVEALSAAYPPPSIDAQEAVDHAEAVLARGRALMGARHDGEALPALREAVDAAARADYPPTLGWAKFELGIALARDSQREAALEAFHEASLIGMRIRDDRLLATTWTEMGRHLQSSESAHDDAFRLLDQAEALLVHIPDNFEIESDLRHARATALSELGKLDEALAELARIDALRPADRLPAVGEWILRGNIHSWRADYPAAERAYDQAAERVRQTVGEQHPIAATVYNGQGVVAFGRGDLEAAEDGFRRAYEILSATLPDDSQELLFSLGNVGEIQRMRGNYPAAMETMSKVERLVKRAFPPVHREVGTTNHNIASTYREWGRHEDALPRYDVAIDVRRKVHGERHAYVANSLTGKGLTLLELGRPADAVRHLEEAQSIRDETDAPPRKRARTAFALARALVATGGDAQRARTLAMQARELLRGQKDEAVGDRLKKIDAWLLQLDDVDGEPTSPAPP